MEIVRFMQLLPGFREFYPEDCARRNYIVSVWRDVAARYGFQEYDGPVLEPMDLYRKKSGGELVGQLFDFTDKGGREVAMRPEMTPTLARMVAGRHRAYRKPLKWFSVASFFRYEKQQRGRLREFLQLNCDLVGDGSAGADAEMLALTVDLLRGFGLGAGDFVLRVSDRKAWIEFLVAHAGEGAAVGDFLAVIDKIERDDPARIEEKLKPFGVTLEQVREFIASGPERLESFRPLREQLEARGLWEYCAIDLTVVRGLAYYSGLVFEVFDRAGALRAVAGGGRYDGLISLMSDGAEDLPALGMGMGDVVLGELIEASPAAKARRDAVLGAKPSAEVFVVVADEARRGDALALVQELRDAGFPVDFSLGSAKVGKQFQAAEGLGARWAVVVGAEWPMVKVKRLADRVESLVGRAEVAGFLQGA